MRTRRTLAAAAVALLVAACGHQASQRSALAGYLRQVNRIERGLQQPVSAVTAAGAQFAKEQQAGGTLTGLLPAEHEAALQRALVQVSALRGRLARLEVPPSGRRLRSLLLQIVDGQVKLTRQVGQLVVFLPSFSSALRPLAPATRRLEVALAQATPPATAIVAAYAGKAAALRQFKSVADGVLRQLGRIHPPAVSKPDYDSEIRALRGMSSSAAQLAAALGSGTLGNIQQLLGEFDRAATSNQSLATQKARIAAIRAYDGQITGLTKLTQAAEQERQRLANTLS